MNITDLFIYLQAPLNNPQWSWGACRQSDRALVLRVWADEYIKRGTARYFRLTHLAVYAEKPSDNGWNERLRHLALLHDPARVAPTYMVICTATDPTGSIRQIAHFDQNSVFVGGDLLEDGGDWWLEARARRDVATIRMANQT